MPCGERDPKRWVQMSGMVGGGSARGERRRRDVQSQGAHLTLLSREDREPRHVGKCKGSECCAADALATLIHTEVRVFTLKARNRRLKNTKSQPRTKRSKPTNVTLTLPLQYLA